MIREARAEDIPQLVELGRKMHAMSSWRKLPYEASSTAEMMNNLIEAEAGVLLMHDHGMLGGLIGPVYFSPVKIAQEMFWFAERDGMSLLKGFEDWSKAQGADFVLMISQALDERTDRLMQKKYERRGYILKERQYVKELN